MSISISDFNALSEQEKRETLQDLKNQIGVSGIVKEWEISRAKVYSMLKKFNIPVKNNATDELKPTTLSTENSQEFHGHKHLSDAIDQKEHFTQESSLKFNTSDSSSKFSLYLETNGTIQLVSETIQMLLGAEKLANTNLHVNISLQEI